MERVFNGAQDPPPKLNLNKNPLELFSSYALQTAESARLDKKRERRHRRKLEGAPPPLHHERVTSYDDEPFEHPSARAPAFRQGDPYVQGEAAGPNSQGRRKSSHTRAQGKVLVPNAVDINSL